MLDTAPQSTKLAPALSERQLQRQSASAPRKVTGKLKVACTRVIHEGEELDVAAKAAGLTTRALRLALAKPHVIQWMKAEKDVFRAYVSAQNIHHAKKIRDTSGNAMAQIGAIKVIEQIGVESAPNAARGSAGLVIVVQTGAATEHPIRVIDNPTLPDKG